MFPHILKQTQSSKYHKAKEIFLRAATDTYATPVWLHQKGLISNEGKCPECKVPTTIMHLTSECKLTEGIRLATTKKITKLGTKNKGKHKDFVAKLLNRPPADDTLVHELGFIPKQEVNKLPQPQQKVVADYHRIKIEQMILTWQLLWEKKGEFHDRNPEQTPNIKQDERPRPDPSEEAPFDETSRKEEHPRQKPAKQSKAKHRRRPWQDTSLNTKPKRKPPALLITHAHQEFSDAQRKAFRPYSTLQPNEFGYRPVCRSTPPTVYLRLRQQLPCKRLPKSNSGEPTLLQKRKQSSMGLPQSGKPSKTPKQKHQSKTQVGASGDVAGGTQATTSKCNRNNKIENTPSLTLGVGRKTAKRSRGLPKPEDEHSNKFFKPNHNTQQNTTTIENTTTHTTAATLLRPMATTGQGTKGEPPPGSTRQRARMTGTGLA